VQGYDDKTNIILSNAIERIINPNEEPEVIPLGLYLVRGGSIVLIGDVDENIDKDIDWSKVRGEALKSTKNDI
jgi:U6 snRNA-associated Sm-like protein LSm8